jgi:hypothetical protein
VGEHPTRSESGQRTARVVRDRTECGGYTRGPCRATCIRRTHWTLVPHEVDLPSTEQPERIDVATVEAGTPIEVVGGRGQPAEYMPGLHLLPRHDEPGIQVAIGRLKPHAGWRPAHPLRMANRHPPLARHEPRERHETRQRGTHVLTRRCGEIDTTVARRKRILWGGKPPYHGTRDRRDHTERSRRAKRSRHEQSTDHAQDRTRWAGAVGAPHDECGHIPPAMCRSRRICLETHICPAVLTLSGAPGGSSP